MSANLENQGKRGEIVILGVSLGNKVKIKEE